MNLRKSKEKFLASPTKRAYRKKQKVVTVTEKEDVNVPLIAMTAIIEPQVPTLIIESLPLQAKTAKIEPQIEPTEANYKQKKKTPAQI